MELNNIVGFKAIDADGNEQNVTVDEMVDMVATRMVSALSETSALSEISTLATAAATGNDVYENELPTVTDAANVRVLQSSGEAAQMTMQSLATKLGGLIPLASENNNGLMSAYYSQSITRMNGYGEGISMSLDKLPIGFSYLNVVDSSDFPSKSGAVLKFKFGATMYLQGWFMNGFYVRCIRDGVDTGWKKITTS